MNKTNIQYLDYTWNPIAMRCDRVSLGCDNCWHLGFANRHAHNPKFRMEKRLAYEAGGRPYLDRTKMDEPLRKKKPLRIGVQFMGDLFHDKIPDGWIDEVFDVCHLAPEHTFFFLTKRQSRLRQAILRFKKDSGKTGNMWFGVSVEDQETADLRIPYLLSVLDINRFISVEPLLKAVSLEGFDGKVYRPWLDTKAWACGIHWIICGAETGPKKRPMKWEWAISLANQCKAAGVPFFFKEPWKTAPDACRRRELPDYCDCESCKDCRAKGF